MAITPLGLSFAKQVAANKTLLRWIKPIASWYANLSGYRQMGLKYDDLIPEENPVVQKALTRLSDKETYDRVFRIRTAMQQSLLHKQLPREQWMKPEDDVPYLTPIIEEVMKENAERRQLDTMEVTRKK